MAANLDYEQAGELKFGQVGIANLRIRTLDPARLAAEMAERVQRAPKLFERAAVVVDFGGLSQCPGATETRALLEALRGAGVLPVALAYGTRELDELSLAVGLPLLAKFRAQYERAEASRRSFSASRPRRRITHATGVMRTKNMRPNTSGFTTRPISLPSPIQALLRGVSLRGAHRARAPMHKAPTTAATLQPMTA